MNLVVIFLLWSSVILGLAIHYGVINTVALKECLWPALIWIAGVLGHVLVLQLVSTASHF